MSIRIKKGGIGIDESESYMSNDKKEGHEIIDKVACPLFPIELTERITLKTEDFSRWIVFSF